MKVAPARLALTVPPVSVSRLALYCTIRVASVTPLPLLSTMGMRLLVLLGILMLAGLLLLSGPRANCGSSGRPGCGCSGLSLSPLP